MSGKFRIVTNGRKYKVQERVLWCWKDCCSLGVPLKYDTYEEALNKLNRLSDYCDESGYKPVTTPT